MLTFISYDTQNPSAQRWAAWVYEQLHQGGVSVVLPQRTWALGYWHQYLQAVVEGAERVVVILSQSYLAAPDAFVEGQRRLVMQMPSSRLLVVLLEECQSLLPEGSVFYRASWVDLRSAFNGEAQASASLVEAVQALGS